MEVSTPGNTVFESRHRTAVSYSFLRWIQRLTALGLGLWSYGCIILLVSTVAAVPVLQFAALGYILECSVRISQKRPWIECIPGQLIARRLVLAAIVIGLSWLPIWLVTDLSYSADLIESGSLTGLRLRYAAVILSLLWLTWIAWAMFRGGRIRDFLWPAPIRFLKTFWRPSTWRKAEDQLWSLWTSLRLVSLLRLGFFASVGAILWLTLPAALVIASLSGGENGGLAIVGLLGALGMIWVLARIPYLQMSYAESGRFRSFFDVKRVNESYKRTPWSMLWGLFILFLFAVPLYLLRIERIPSELNWILTFFFVVLLLPSHLVIGWAWGRAQRKTLRMHWFWRILPWSLRIVTTISYLGVIYLAKFTSWEGGLVFLLQHTVLPPVPFFLR